MAVALPPTQRASGAEVQRSFVWTRERYDEAVNAGVFTPEDNVELLDGHIVPKMPQNKRHRVATVYAHQALAKVFASGSHVQVQAPIALSDRTEPEPDVAIIRGAPLDHDPHPSADAVLLLVEVADSSLLRDRLSKAVLYAEAGVAEYWIVNLQDSVLEVHRDPAGEAYRTKTTHASGETVTPVHAPEASIAIADLLP
jgi:Uma2 family endonuclease